MLRLSTKLMPIVIVSLNFPASWIRKSILILALVCSLSAGQAANPPEFERANQLYDQGKFAEAKQIYESIARAGNLSANLFYNLGNTEFRLGDKARAVIDYERALLIEPGHPEAHANLALVRSQTGARIENRRWFDYAFFAIGENSYAIVATIAAWTAVFLLVAIYFRKGRANQPLWLGAIAAVVIAAYAGAAVYEFEQKAAFSIVTAPLADARLAPAENAQTVEPLPMGSRVRVRSERGAWDYCVLPGDERGWVPANALERIRPVAS
jgi:tetratricopeptide (TPR) repeat protein